MKLREYECQWIKNVPVRENFIQRKNPAADSGITSSKNSHKEMVVSQKTIEYAPACVERKAKNAYIVKWIEIKETGNKFWKHVLI